MPQITTVTITQGTPEAPIRTLHVTAEVIAPGLAITPAIDKDNGLTGGWTVTHMPSGHIVMPVDPCIGCIRYAARHLTEADLDWTRDMDALRADEAVRQAAHDFAYDAEGCDSADCGITGLVPQAA
ncbi:hypothetical protein AB0I37_25100 [Micromonospora purpureochromogenes]|uniref:hypothetical protein n=1 Tax=Micromonospora purpureochromogenes TaxID=47872 RepID=UPI0033F2B071